MLQGAERFTILQSKVTAVGIFSCFLPDSNTSVMITLNPCQILTAYLCALLRFVSPMVSSQCPVVRARLPGGRDSPSSVRAPGCQGERTGETFFRLYAKALAPIGKTPCACTQNLLALTRNKTEKKLLAVRFPYRCTTARSGSSAAWDARPASTRRAACGRNDMSVR